MMELLYRAMLRADHEDIEKEEDVNGRMFVLQRVRSSILFSWVLQAFSVIFC